MLNGLPSIREAASWKASYMSAGFICAYAKACLCQTFFQKNLQKPTHQMDCGKGLCCSVQWCLVRWI